MQRALSARWQPAAIFGVAFLVRALYLFQARAHPLYDYVAALIDSLYYHRHASDVAEGVLLHGTPFFLGPLYPYWMGLLYSFAGPSPEVVRWSQALLGAASCSLLYAVGARLFDRRVGLVAGLILAFYPLHLYYTGMLLPTILVLFLDLLLLWLLVREVEAPSWEGAVSAGVVVGLSTLAKSNALLLVPALLVVWLWLRREDALRPRLLWSAAFVGVAFLTIAPATLHNVKVSDQFVLVTTSTGRNLWKGNGPIANGTHPLGHQDRSKAGLGKQMAGAADPEQVVKDSSDYVGRTWEYVADDPSRAVSMLGWKFVVFFNAVELGVRDQFYFAQEYASLLRLPLAWAWVAPLGLAGALAAWSLRGPVLLVHVTLAVQVASFVVVFVLARYRIVAVACLLLFASALLVAWADAARARNFRRIVPGALVAAVAAIFVNWPLDEFPRDRGFALVYEKIGDMHHQKKRNAAAVAAYRQALAEDWQGQDPGVRVAETRLKIARDLEAGGDRAGAVETLELLLAELEVKDFRGVRVQQSAEQELSRLTRRRR